MREPGLPGNLDIIPRVPKIGVTSSRTTLHLAAVRALATRPEVTAFALLLPSPVTNGDLGELLEMLGHKLTALEVQQVRRLRGLVFLLHLQCNRCVLPPACRGFVPGMHGPVKLDGRPFLCVLTVVRSGTLGVSMRLQSRGACIVPVIGSRRCQI